MKFAQISMLNLLWLVVPLTFFFFMATKRHQAVMKRFVEEHLVKKIASNLAYKKRLLKNILLVCVLIFSVLALSRPQWGFQWQEVKHQAIDILVVIDVSKSMLTKDVKPNRLERTKLAVKDLLKRLKGDRVGLIGFAGDAFLLCPLTSDYTGFLLSLDDLGVHSIPRGGTNISVAIHEALRGHENVPNEYKSIIIITDGDNLEGDPLNAAKGAKEDGVKIYAIGIGTKEGELIQVANRQGKTDFLKDSQGNFVKSRLNERLLQQISLITGGVYIKASGANFGLDYVYDRELSKIKKREIESRMEKKYFERFQIPLSVASILLILESCVSTRRKREEDA